MRVFKAFCFGVTCLAALRAAGAEAPLASAKDAVKAASAAVCLSGIEAPGALAARLGYASADRDDRGRIVLSDPARPRLTVSERRRGARLDGYEIVAASAGAGGPRPLLLIRLGGDCAMQIARALLYRADGRAEALQTLDAALEPSGAPEPLDPQVPPGMDPGGVLVGHIDSGVNYLLPEIAARLARRADGSPLGWDFWDDDPRPFDVNATANPFFPLHHGTAVASILLAEAPAARLAPYRYPRPDMARMGAVVEALTAAGAGIVMMPMGSRRQDDWRAFAEAVGRHPEILFVVSAGNDGRDIDKAPVYPAALDLPNLLVVTSADDFGRLAAGSNWGAASVDVMVPGEGIAVTDHRGAKGRASGSSFAVPRVAALAARLKARHPDWRAAQLIEAIAARTAPPMIRGAPVVRLGWIVNPADDG